MNLSQPWAFRIRLISAHICSFCMTGDVMRKLMGMISSAMIPTSSFPMLVLQALISRKKFT